MGGDDGNPLVAFISLLYHVFVFLVNLTIDLACLPFLIFALVMPWRAPFLISAIVSKPSGFDGFGSRDEYRSTSLSQFFVGFYEGVSYLLFVCLLLSGLRSAMVLERWKSDKYKWNVSIQANTERCGMVWGQLGGLLLDLIPAGFLGLLLLLPWRWPALWRAVHREGVGWLFQTMCPCTRPKKADREDESELRLRWMGQAVLGLIDALTAFPLAIVMLTGIRTRKLYRKLRSQAVHAEYDQDVEWNPEARAVVWKQFGSLLVDCIFVPLALIVFLCPWRTLSLVHLMNSDKRGMAKRWKAIKLFFSTWLDLPYLLAGLLIFVSSWWRARTFWEQLRLRDRTFNAKGESCLLAGFAGGRWSFVGR